MTENEVTIPERTVPKILNATLSVVPIIGASVSLAKSATDFINPTSGFNSSELLLMAVLTLLNAVFIPSIAGFKTAVNVGIKKSVIKL